MKTVRNVLFSIVIAGIVLSPIAYRAIAESPFWFDMPSRSQLEARFLTTPSDVAKTSFLDGTFQSAAESFMSDSAPKLDWVMRFSAQLQRLGISTASVPFGYGYYHTFYGSNFVADTSSRRILPLPAAVPDSKKARTALRGWVKTINDAADAHPETRFVVVQVTEASQTKSSPIYDYVTSYEKVDEDYARDHVTEKFNDNVVSFCESVASPEELQEEWFAGDAHWTIERAAKAYNNIADKLDLEPYVYDRSEAATISPEWFGSSARGANDFDYPSQLNDMLYEYPNLKCFRVTDDVEKGKKYKLGKRERILSGALGADDLSIYDGYSQYYGGDQALIENEGPNNGKTCLVIGDSFTHCLKRMIANNYERTLVLLPGNTGRIKRTLESLFEEYHFDDVIALTQITKFTYIALNSPKFIGL